MNVYKVERKDGKISWCEDIAMIVIAEDERHAERKARWESEDFKNSNNIKVTKISLDKEAVILVENTGG